MDLFGLDALLRFFLRNLGRMNLTTGQGGGTSLKRGLSEVSKGSRSSSRSRSGSESAGSEGSNTSNESTESQRSQAYEGEMKTCMSKYFWKNNFTQPKIEQYHKAVNVFGQGVMVTEKMNAVLLVAFLYFLSEEKKRIVAEGQFSGSGRSSKSTSSEAETPWVPAFKVAIEKTSKMHNSSFLTVWQRTVFPWLKLLKNTGQSQVPGPTKRAKYSKEHWKSAGSLYEDKFNQQAMEFIEARRDGGSGTTADQIVKHLQTKYDADVAARLAMGEEIPEDERLEFTVSLVRYHLRVDLGMRFGSLGVEGPNFDDPKHRNMMEAFLDFFDLALKLEVSGEAILVYMDETYVNMGHHMARGWMFPDDEKSQNVKARSKGQRVVILDAFDKDRRLAAEESDCPEGWDKGTCCGDCDKDAFEALLFEVGLSVGFFIFSPPPPQDCMLT